MDALVYFFSQLLTLNILLALVAFLLGLFFGWLIWGRRSKVEVNAQGCSSGDSCSADLDACNKAKADLEAELKACMSARANLEKKAGKLEGDLDSAKSDTKSLKADSGGTEASALREKNMNYFSADIASGKIKNDETYGLLYTAAPDDVDDLTRIKGVAGVLNKTLNDYGVYKYRQIALWTSQISEDFSEKIAFKGRVERDDWVGQCKQFHEEKYGEKI